MSKRIKVYILLCISVMMAALSVGGCQLAKDEENGQQGSVITDDLIGVYVTLGSVNTIDWMTSQSEYADNEKIYATKAEEQVDGTEYTTRVYSFEGIEGIPFFNIYVTDSEYGDYTSIMCNEAIFDSHQELKVEDELVYTTLEASVYLSDEEIVYLNPVYQEDDGDVYMLPEGVGNHISGNATTACYISEENSTEGGVKATITFSVVGTPEKTSFVAMGNEDEVVWSQVYVPGEAPEELKLPEGTQYLIVKTEFAGEQEAKIDVYTKYDEYIHIFKKGTSTALENEGVRLKWE